MRLVFDLEANGLKPTEIWVVVCRDIDTGEYYVFRNPTQDSTERARLLSLIERADLCIGHNIYGYDLCVLQSLLGLSKEINSDTFLDTFILSRLIDYPRDGHSIEDYGVEFGIEKEKFNDWSRYSIDLEERCIRDVDICHRIYSKYQRYINRVSNREAIRLEHSFQLVCNKLHENGFAFNSKDAEKLLAKVTEELKKLDDQIHETFKPKSKLIREVTPKLTKFGTLNRSDFRFEKSGDLSSYNGGPFSRIVFEPFNPSSPKQVVEILNTAGWQPVDKTKTHIEALRSKVKDEKRLEHFKIYGWTVNETNLATLPDKAPKAARLLAQRIIFESRRRTLTEWLELVDKDGRIHGEFHGIGAWTQRMAHRRPNTANIPNEFDNNGKVKLLGAQMRKLWVAPKNRLLVGVDAEGIQLRGFAHYVNEPGLIKSLVEGKKSDKTDPHSYNQKVLGDVCKARQAAKRFLYALFLGAGMDKLAAILECSRPEMEVALERLISQYPGFAEMRSQRFPADAKRGWLTAIDGRPIKIPGETEGTRRHLSMSGYLQSFEAIVIKQAAISSLNLLDKEKIECKIVDIVHDEFQIEVPNNMDIAIHVAEVFANAIKEAGEHFKLNCPLAGSYWSEDNNDYTISTNWKMTH